jgi:hypothetical protein
MQARNKQRAELCSALRACMACSSTHKAEAVTSKFGLHEVISQKIRRNCLELYSVITFHNTQYFRSHLCLSDVLG